MDNCDGCSQPWNKVRAGPVARGSNLDPNSAFADLKPCPINAGMGYLEELAPAGWDEGLAAG
jgi:hypothetical protein